MRADLLHVVTAISNPKRFKSRIALFRQFAQHMAASGVQLTVVECAYGERPFDLAVPETSSDYVHVGVRAQTMVWTKENLINLGVARLPAEAKYIAWVDADVTFRNPGWAAETVHALQHYDIVQPWAHCYDLGPNGEHVELHRSFGSTWYRRDPIVQGPKCGGSTGYPFAHPGYAWAAKRQALEWTGGLIETAALGAADHHMAVALIGKVDLSIHGGMTEGYKVPLYRWQDRAMQHIAGNVGYVPGTIEHGWHGTKESRGYVSRWDILVENRFDPATDLKKNTFGVVELAGNKPELRHAIDRYFQQRNEDSNSL